MPRTRALALILLAALAAALLLLVHGLLPGQIRDLPVAYVYSGLIECLSDAGLFRAPVCPSIGVPVGHVPLTDGPHLVAAAALRSLTRVEPLAVKTVIDAALLLLSFVSLLALQRKLGVVRPVAALVAVCYLVLPMLVGHAGIQAFAVGILLLPAYLLVELVVLGRLAAGRLGGSTWVAVSMVVGYVFVRTAAVFQDPYTAAMVAAVSAIVVASHAASCLRDGRAAPAAKLVLLWLSSVVIAVGSYRAWVPGGAAYHVVPLDFFRAQGVDVVTLFVPSGSLWWAAASGVGVSQWNAYAYYGDPTHVENNYLGYSLLLPLGAYAVWRLRRGRRVSGERSGPSVAVALALAAGFCMLLALGPSLKVADQRPADARGRFEYEDYFMAREAATLALPTERLFVTLPVLRQMRAVYRWIVVPKLILLLAAAWVASRLYERNRAWGLALAGLMLVEHFPYLPGIVESSVENHADRRQFDAQVLADLRRALVPGERVFFLSSSNDFLVDYLVPKLGVESYNIGGDKNAALAEPHWPASLRELRRSLPSLERWAPAIAAPLLAGEVDAVVIPYFDLRWHAYSWPPSEAERRKVSDRVRRELDPPPAPLQLTEASWFAVVSRDRARRHAGAGNVLVAGDVLVADPNPIVICDGAPHGRTVLTWRAATTNSVEIRVGSPAGKLFAQGGVSGAAATGIWVQDGMEFYLQDLAAADPSSPEHTLARVRVRVSRDCPQR